MNFYSDSFINSFDFDVYLLGSEKSVLKEIPIKDIEQKIVIIRHTQKNILAIPLLHTFNVRLKCSFIAEPFNSFINTI